MVQLSCERRSQPRHAARTWHTVHSKMKTSARACCRDCKCSTLYFHLLNQCVLCNTCASKADYQLIPYNAAMSQYCIPKSVVDTLLSIKVWRWDAFEDRHQRVLLTKDVRAAAEKYWKKK